MAAPDADQKAKIFISYSRQDAGDFAEDLVVGLELAGFSPFLDRHDISAGEDWEMRLGALIGQADTVVFVISPQGVRSEHCTWEANKTIALSKRLIPVIYKPVPDADIPGVLRRLQFIRFDTRVGILRPLCELATALRQDLDWVREHTRLGSLAARWQARERPEWLLLRGDDVDIAHAWMANRKADAPAITDLMRVFLNASIEAEHAEEERNRQARRQRLRMRTAVGLLAMAIIAGLFAWWRGQWVREQAYWLMHARPHLLTQARMHALTPLDVPFKECAHCPEMIVVPGDTTFWMGGPPDDGGDKSEYPRHPVTIVQPFAVAKYELTFEQWDACAAYGDCNPNISSGAWERGLQPVINVTWEDAQRYVEWLSRVTGKPYRLLTEAEWEYAARAGTTTHFSFKNEAALDNHAWYEANSLRRPHPVGDDLEPNPFGLHNMHGNVSEWVQDCFSDNYRDASPIGLAWLSSNCRRRVIRGGDWQARARALRSAQRDWNLIDEGSDRIGFRVARELTSK